jgi:hypothetical protein
MQSIPTLEHFLAAPIEEIQAVAPATMVLAGAGTRREAILHGIPLDQYANWSMSRLTDVCLRIFDLGIKDLFVPVIRATQAAETGKYGRQLWDVARQTLGDIQNLERLVTAGVQVRCFGKRSMPEIVELLDEIEAFSARGSGTRTLWWLFARTAESPWNEALAAICAAGATSHADAIRAVYGRPIEPVGVYLAFGKPFFSVELMPPLLEGQAAAFWYQQPGYPLTEPLLRRILYEAAFVRRTWVPDKSDRYNDVLTQRAIWEQPLVLGLGQRVGDFWYPLPPDRM